jgi:hypothetical protein
LPRLPLPQAGVCRRQLLRAIGDFLLLLRGLLGGALGGVDGTLGAVG